jgi:hypothetical protein
MHAHATRDDAHAHQITPHATPTPSKGTRIAYDKAAFVKTVHELFKSGGGRLVDGYAPFCKHVFVPNFVGAQLGALEITDSNRQLLRSGYTRRRAEELPVLTRRAAVAVAVVGPSHALPFLCFACCVRTRPRPTNHQCNPPPPQVVPRGRRPARP